MRHFTDREMQILRLRIHRVFQLPFPCIWPLDQYSPLV